MENYTFHGTGNYEECDAYIKRLLNPDACKSTGWVNCIEPASIPSVASERKFMVSKMQLCNVLLFLSYVISFVTGFRFFCLCGQRTGNKRERNKRRFPAQVQVTLQLLLYQGVGNENGEGEGK